MKTHTLALVLFMACVAYLVLVINIAAALPPTIA